MGSGPFETTTPDASAPNGGTVNVGTVMEGYEFQGGDPGNKSNWKKVE